MQRSNGHDYFRSWCGEATAMIILGHDAEKQQALWFLIIMLEAITVAYFGS